MLSADFLSTTGVLHLIAPSAAVAVIMNRKRVLSGC